jgi:hypothetical protein
MPASFGYKCAWIAVRTDAPLSVANVLDLRDVRSSSWEDGNEAAYGRTSPRRAFLTPAIDGWVLCASVGFFDLADSGQDLASFLCDLSRQLRTTVQFFLTYRVVEAHVWGCAENGNVIRLYGYSSGGSGKLFDIGDQTDAEVSLGFSFFDERSPGASDPKSDYWVREDLTFPSENHVMQLAGKWSIDPTTLEERNLADGWVGEIN